MFPVYFNRFSIIRGTYAKVFEHGKNDFAEARYRPENNFVGLSK